MKDGTGHKAQTQDESCMEKNRRATDQCSFLKVIDRVPNKASAMNGSGVVTPIMKNE